jgi:hypothetical protein
MLIVSKLSENEAKGVNFREVQNILGPHLFDLVKMRGKETGQDTGRNDLVRTLVMKMMILRHTA